MSTGRIGKHVRFIRAAKKYWGSQNGDGSPYICDCLNYAEGDEGNAWASSFVGELRGVVQHIIKKSYGVHLLLNPNAGSSDHSNNDVLVMRESIWDVLMAIAVAYDLRDELCTTTLSLPKCGS
jgi:hypothetical protein